MYCNKCHKQSPDNFIKCAYCGARLDRPKKRTPQRFVKKSAVKLHFSFRLAVRVMIAFAVVLTVIAVFTATFVGSKPEKVVKNFVKSIQSADGDLYYSLFDDNTLRYKRDSRYFAEDETYKQMIAPMEQSNEFYIDKCGEKYRLNYSITAGRTLSDSELEKFSDVLETNFGYVEFPSRVDILTVEIVASGDKGNYKSVYNDFWCMKIKGHWYRIDSTISEEYLKNEATSG